MLEEIPRAFQNETEISIQYLRGLMLNVNLVRVMGRM